VHELRAAQTSAETIMAEDTLSLSPELLCFREYAEPPEIIPGRTERDWMDATSQHFAYRCTPLSIANASGWELVLPGSFSATWHGGRLTSDITIRPTSEHMRLGPVVESVFGHGTLTFHPGYLFRTSPGWALIARGAPNIVKDGIVALEGLVETDWLPFTFTMNWRFTRPGTVHFQKGECFCFIAPVPHALLDKITPRICDLSENQNLKGAYDEWRRGRSEFHSRVARGDPAALKQGWQRDYLQGRDPSGLSEPKFHLAKRRLQPPQR
jgi:hypothetical protein